MNKTRRNAFTLVEVLIVVVIMAILAATIIPQFSDSSKDAKFSSVKFNLHTLRSQIELYKAQHDGLPPLELDDLTEKTNSTRVVGVDPALFPYGPYVRALPDNPFSTAAAGSKNAVKAVADAAAPAASVTALEAGGWLYDGGATGTGGVWIDHSVHVAE